VLHFTPIASEPALEAAARFYNGGDLTMRAIWINAVADRWLACRVRRMDSPDGFTGIALTHRH
jgi:hypothetical protein